MVRARRRVANDYFVNPTEVSLAEELPLTYLGCLLKLLTFMGNSIIRLFFNMEANLSERDVEFGIYSFLLPLDDFVRVLVSALVFLMVTAALYSSLVTDKLRHFLVEGVRSI